MGRVKAVELVAHGVQCDRAGCSTLTPVRSEQSRPPGYYVTVARVTEGSKRYFRRSSELYFCAKECLLESMKWDLSRHCNAGTEELLIS